MKLPVDTLEAALRQKRQAAAGAPRPLKRLRRGGRGESAGVEVAPAAPRPATRSDGEVPTGEAASAPAGSRIEEGGRVPAANTTAVVILDPEEERSPAADAPEAEQAAAAAGPSGLTEPEAEGAQACAERGAADGEPAVEAVVAGSQGGEPRSLSPRSALRATRPRIDGPQRGVVPQAPQLGPLGNAGLAADLLKRMRTAETDKVMRQQSHAAILDMVMLSVVQMGHGAIALRDELLCSSETLAKAVARADKYKKERTLLRQGLAKLRQEAQTREKGLDDRVKEAESRASAAEAELALVSARLRAADAQVEDLTRRLSHAEGQIESARSEVLAAGEIAAAAEKAAVDAGHEKAGAVAYADEANARAEEARCRAAEAEARAGEAEAQAGEAKAQAEEAKARAEEAEARAQQAEARAKQAVADYKSSAEFEQEVIEGSLDAYVKGFDVCKARISVAFNISGPDFESIQAGDLGEASAEEEDQEESGPGEP